MTRSYRWLGGIGYILMLIPLVSFVGFIITGIAWIMAGSDTKQGVFKATGVLMFINMILSITMLAIWFPLLQNLISGFSIDGYPSVPPPGLFTELLETFWLFILLVATAAVLGLVEWILELVSHFRAASIFNVKWFRRAGWMRIITVIVAVIVIISFVFIALSASFYMSFFTMPSDIFNILGIFMLGIAGIAILGLLSLIFSAVSFFSIPEAQRERAPPYLPPPPE